ncbi:hypothetical protein [Flavobacterium sp.]|uniref:hypothetical protein n=1 Tax=Flavobacterium sp. TaxID=239 RepID=UPI003C390DD3
MKKKLVIISLLLVTIVAVLLFFNREKGLLKDQYENVSTDSCECQASWFPHDQTPPPEEGDGSPFDTSSTTNCIFHQWSWQKFLWLTKPLANGNPLFLDSLNIVSPEMEPVSPQLGLKLVLSSINQAGSDGVLVSNPKNNKQIVADTVFYSIHVNDAFIKKAISMASLIHSGKLPYSNLETFPVGAFELKVSWINVNAIPKEKIATYFTTQAAFKNAKGQYEIKTVALLGMHVVGVVKNHPEFIWATFEHRDIAPVYDWKNNTVASAAEKLFYESGTATGLQGIKWDSKNKKPYVANKAFILFDYGVPRNSGTNAFMSTSQSEPMNFNNIDTINKCVESKLTDVFKNYFYNGSIWLNTDGLSSTNQAKAIVTRDITSALPDSLVRGSTNLANITMETYTQTFKNDIHKIDAASLVNCFTCHQSENFDTIHKGRSPLYLSHVFGSYLYTTQPKLLKGENNAKEKHIEKTRLLKIQQFQKFVRAKK